MQLQTWLEILDPNGVTYSHDSLVPMHLPGGKTDVVAIVLGVQTNDPEGSPATVDDVVGCPFPEGGVVGWVVSREGLASPREDVPLSDGFDKVFEAVDLHKALRYYGLVRSLGEFKAGADVELAKVCVYTFKRQTRESYARFYERVQRAHRRLSAAPTP